jgi:phenylacetate-CoA ligase
MPRLVDLEGRAPVRFRTTSGDWINAQDVASILRRYPLVQHSFEQDQSGTCRLVYRAISHSNWLGDELEEELRLLLGADVQLHISEDPGLGMRSTSGKVLPFRSCWLEE